MPQAASSWVEPGGSEPALAEPFAAPPPRRVPARRRSRAPMIAALLVAMAGIAGLAYLLARGRNGTPPPVVATSPAVAHSTAGAQPEPPAAEPAGEAASVAPPEVPAPAPPLVVPRIAPAIGPVRSAQTPPRPAVVPAQPSSPPMVVPRIASGERAVRLPSDAAVATEEALGARVLNLPPAAPPQAGSQPTAASPAFQPPPPPDPAAPVVTRRPY